MLSPSHSIFIRRQITLATNTSSHPNAFIRLASTSNRIDSDDAFHHKDWPKKEHPTPYEILNIKPSQFQLKELRKQYYSIAKIYHPDISSNIKHIDHGGKHLSDEHKSERFKHLTDAYNLLKDRKKKALYDQYKIGWRMSDSLLGDTHSQRPRAAYATAKTYHADFNDHAYWNASNWEDYENLRRNHKPMNKEEKIKVLAGILFVMVASASIQGWFILENVEQSLLENRRVHDTCEKDLSLAYLNYGFDDSRLSRIRRFLWFRTFGLYTDKESLDRDALENERLIDEIMGEEK